MARGGRRRVGLLTLQIQFGLGGAGADDFVNRWLYDGLELLAAAGCLLRAG